MFELSENFTTKAYRANFKLSTMDFAKMLFIMDFAKAMDYENNDKTIFWHT